MDISIDTLSDNQLREAVAEKSKWLAARYQEATVDDSEGRRYDMSRMTGIDGDSMQRVETLKAKNEELNSYKSALDSRREIKAMAASAKELDDWSNKPAGAIEHPSDGSRQIAEVKSVGRQFIESADYQRYKGSRNWPGEIQMPDVSIMNAVFRTGAGWNPQDLRLSRVELDPQRPIAVIDSVPMLPTSESAIVYMEETTFTNNAAETAESTATTDSDLIGEAALALTERTQTVEWLPVFIPVTQQQMEDEAGIQAYVDMRLSYMLRARLDSQILAGDGSTPNILGTKSVAGIQTQAKGADPTPDAVYKLFNLIRSAGFAEPSVVFFHHTDWEAIRLLRTADGIYLFGSPMDTGPSRIWGVPVVLTTANAVNTAVAGDYTTYSALYTKRGITLAVSDSHQSYFTRGMLAIRADMRIAMVHFRPEAFGTITGI